MNNILFIVEGEKDEVRILGNDTRGLLSLIGVNANIVSVANPIYELYDFLHNDEYDDIVSYLKMNKKIKIDRVKGAFSAIYLVFDFEHHYQKYSDDKIKDMLKYFDNETENGKLYINYPMVEAFYHIKSIPDKDYVNRKVNLDILKNSGKRYKKLVNEETCIRKSNIKSDEYVEIVKNNYIKAKKICNNCIDYLNILNYEINCVNVHNYIDVLSTLPLFLTDYYYNKVEEIISN